MSLSEDLGPVEGDRVRMEPQGLCHQCVHRTRPFPPQCRAFPDEIPVEILIGDFVHTKPYPGDRGIMFERKGGLKVAIEATE